MPPRPPASDVIRRKGSSLQDISRNLGISISTVSRALHNSPSIHPDTRAKVHAEALRIGYVMRARGADNPPRKMRNLLVLALSQSTSSHQGYMAGISRASVALNINILSYHCSPAEAALLLQPSRQPAALRMKDLFGIILVHRWPNEVVAALSAKWPVASLIHRYPGHPVDVVGTDDEANLQVLIDHLQKQGHSRIGFFGYNPAFSWARARYAAYVEALLAEGLPFEPASTIQVGAEILGDPNPPNCATYFKELKARLDSGVKAWITSSFVVAQGLCVVLTEAGLKLPRDVAITGYHGGGRGPELPGMPRPTSIEVDSEMIGATAVHHLYHHSQQSVPTATSLLLPAKLVQGETTLAV